MPPLPSFGQWASPHTSTAPHFQQDPFPALRRLRESDPVHLTRNGWILTRYQDCVEVLTSRNFGMRGIEHMLKKQLGPGSAFEVIANRFHSFDPPEHTRLRTLVSKSFSARRVRELSTHVENLVEQLLDKIGDETSFDLVEKFSYPLPLQVITEILGTPLEEREKLGTWSDRILRLQGMFAPSAQVLEEGHAAARDFMAYMGALIEERRGTPGDDLLSALIAAEDQGERLTAEEVAECVVFLSNAGHSTTRSMIGSAVAALLQNREQWEMLVADPSLIGEAVEEALRFNCALTSTLRFARQDTMIGKRKIAAGAMVGCALNAANRDPEQFPDPDRFDIGRDNKKHLAFGGGVHLCLGASLARTQIQIALGALVRRYPKMQLATQRIEWRPGLYRGPVRLHVVVR